MTKKPTPNPKDKKASLAEARAKLAAGAKQIHGMSKPAKARVIDDTLPEIEEVEVDVKMLIKKCLTLDPIYPAVTVNEKTTTGEGAKLFDYFSNQAESVQFIVGDLILGLENSPAFKVNGVSKFTEAMLATGRSLDSCKAYRSVAFHTPPEMRLLPYTHTRETVKIKNLEDRKAIIEKFAKLADEGKKPSVQEVRAAADKFAPRKPKGKKAVITIVPTREATPEEEAVLKELEENGKAFASHLEMSDFLHNLSEKHVAKIRDILKRLNATYLRLTT